MELRFENCCTLTKEALLEMNRKSRNPVFVAAVAVLCLAYLVNGVRAAIAGYPAALILPLLCAVLLGLFAYYLPTLQSAAEYRKNMRAYGREARCITKFYDDAFVVENLTTGSTLRISYSHIRRITESERYVFILLDSRVISPVDKTDFINGDAESFMPFINAKAQDTVRRRRVKNDGSQNSPLA